MISGDIQPLWKKLQTASTTILTGTKQRLLVSAIVLCNTNAANRTVSLWVTSGGADYYQLKDFVITANNKEILKAEHGPLLALADGEVLKALCSGANDDVHLSAVTTTLGTADIGAY